MYVYHPQHKQTKNCFLLLQATLSNEVSVVSSLTVQRDISENESDGSGDENNTKTDDFKRKYSLKQLIRSLHIANPVYHVMCLLGKRYPATLEDYVRAKLVIELCFCVLLFIYCC